MHQLFGLHTQTVVYTMVQHRAARFITNNYSPWANVTEILHNLDLPTLEEQRKSLKLVMIFKIIHSQVQVKSGNCLIQTASHTQDHSQQFLQPHSRIDAYLYSCYPSTTSSAVKSPNINSFKQHINFSWVINWLLYYILRMEVSVQ